MQQLFKFFLETFILMQNFECGFGKNIMNNLNFDMSERKKKYFLRR